MTCVAFDGVTVAAESLSVGSYGFMGRATKIWNLPRTGVYHANIVGGAGDYGRVTQLVRYLQANPHVTVDTLDVSALSGFNPNDVGIMWVRQLRPDSPPEIWALDGSVMTLRPLRPFYAIGSGCDFATTAMYLGRSAEQAVRIACEFINNCGGEIQTISLKDAWACSAI